MKIGFLALRKGFLRVMGSVIQAALDRKHTVILCWNPDEAKPGEAVAEEDLKAWPGTVPILYHRRSSLLPLREIYGISALVAPSLHATLRGMGLETEATAMGATGLRFYSIDYLLETVTSDPDGYRVLDTTFYASRHQRDLHWKLMAEGFSQLSREIDLNARSAVCGSVMMDQLGLVDRAAVRKKYGLPPDQPVVLLMSLKMAVPDPWRRLVWGRGWRGLRAAKAIARGHAAWAGEILRGHGYRDLVEALRRFCQRSGAALVVKSRVKNDDPPFLRRLADAFVYDESLFPYTSVELMAIASLCVHFQSGAVIEAAFCGVPSLSIAVSQEHLGEYASFDEIYGGKPGTVQNFPGIVRPVDYRDAVSLLDGAGLADFRIDPEARRQYVEKFLGFDDTRSGERVLEVIERTSAAP